MIDKWFNCEVIGKTIEQRGLIFKKNIYIVALKFEDGQRIERKISFSDYCDIKEGSQISINMYSTNNKNWYFTREEANDIFRYKGFGV